MTTRSFAFVLPRFGEGIIGGAETLAGSLASQLAKRGSRVEVFTTCARDNRSWKNEFPAETSIEFGIQVHRYPVDERDLDSWIPHQIRISEGMRLTVDEQLEWMSEGVNSKALYSELFRRSREFDAILFAPYLFATTFWGSMIAREKAILIPCLHDESYAYLEVIASMFGQVRGALFNSLPEQRLARSLYGAIKGGEVGMGFEPLCPAEGELGPYLAGQEPYLVYVGRKETGKNVHKLIDYFCQAKDDGRIDPNLKLVIAGGGDFSDLHREEAGKREDIVDLSHLSERDKRAVIKHSLALVQPSVNESFSIVLMEAWQLKVPVLVDGGCAVTRHHVEQSGGGLYYEGAAEFAETVRLLLSDSGMRRKLAAGGKEYVAGYYSWDAVLARFDSVMEQFLNA
ncbi:MAG: glycosyltransferase family 4 protein [Deltaproteobacteria bacterium]|nr:glycosyltransferase family 4 protein [Deltaproteobacteria bacterium]